VTIAKKPADGHHYSQLAFLSHNVVLGNQVQVGLHAGTICFLHMARNTFFYALSYFAVSGPRQIKSIQQLSKLIVVHVAQLKIALPDIQGKRERKSRRH
jgi:hypothetical protein